jgi:D,D-heptose 1,7-bisphosphate phosphatase
MKAIFLDRDGTINIDTGHVYKISDFAFEKNAVLGLKQLRDAGFSFFIVTNQSGIGRGLFTEADFEIFNNHLIKQLENNGIQIVKTYFCPFHPTKGIGKYKINSHLRKPGAGMLEKSSKEFEIEKENSWMIGDKLSDTEAGNIFGLKSILLSNEKYPLISTLESKPTYVAQDLLDATKFILNYKKHDKSKN